MRLRDLTATCERLGLAGRRLLVACSGGVDSVVLVHGLHRLREPLGVELSIGHVHHGLRGEAAEADAALVCDLGAKLDLPTSVMRVNPHDLQDGHVSRTRPTLQEAARRARYDALEALMARTGAQHVATAHNLDDQAETVLLRLLRGTGPEGLGGIPEVSPDGRIVRPLLGVPRADISEFARGEGLEWREDATNLDPSYTRNRLRHDWLPGLAEEFNPRLLRALGDLAETLRRDGEWFGDLVDEELARIAVAEPDGLRIDPSPWPRLPDGLARRLVHRMLASAGAGRDTTRTHILRCVEFLRSGRTGSRIELPGGLELRRERDAFRLVPVGVQPRGSC
jgi:tRNA(Ile)-lysidine synthase